MRHVASVKIYSEIYTAIGLQMITSCGSYYSGIRATKHCIHPHFKAQISIFCQKYKTQKQKAEPYTQHHKIVNNLFCYLFFTNRYTLDCTGIEPYLLCCWDTCTIKLWVLFSKIHNRKGRIRR